MTTRLLLLLCLALLPTAHAQTALKAALRAELQRQQLTGLVWTTVGPQGTRSGALGVADARSGAPLRPDSPVEVDSVVKALLALAVLRAAHQGRLDLDEPVAQRLPGLPVANPWPPHTRCACAICGTWFAGPLPSPAALADVGVGAAGGLWAVAAGAVAAVAAVMARLPRQGHTALRRGAVVSRRVAG